MCVRMLVQVAGKYRTSFAARHVVNNALRKSIGDAYAAYVGQVRVVVRQSGGI